MKDQKAAALIQSGSTTLGIELGSTRIKAVLIDLSHRVLATGSFRWENRLENGLWTYRLEDAVTGLQACFASLAEDVRRQFGVKLTTVGAIGISGMMHGYLPLNKNGQQIAPFLTWRNTNTAAAADALTDLFQFNIPLRWSIAQLYQAILNKEPHVGQIDYLTTLSGYIHFLLTGKRVIGIGDASGMFPIDPATRDYDERMLSKFRSQISREGFSWDIKDILPKVLTAGADAGRLTSEGARLLDPTGTLQPGIPMAPPEGDAGTGMVATNSVEIGSGSVSAGTSIFAMVVLEKNLSKVYRDIDIVTTPNGHPVAMVHCNNGTSELDTWMHMFLELLDRTGTKVPAEILYEVLFQESLRGELDCGGVLLYNYISAEPVTELPDGRPLLVRRKDSTLSLANFMRSQIYSVIASLAVGMRILSEENVRINRMTAHGGLLKTPGVAQNYLAAAMGAPVTVMDTAGEGGPYGMAILAAFCLSKNRISLEHHLENTVFSNAKAVTVNADPALAQAFASYLENYRDCLPLEQYAVQYVPAQAPKKG